VLELGIVTAFGDITGILVDVNSKNGLELFLYKKTRLLLWQPKSWICKT